MSSEGPPRKDPDLDTRRLPGEVLGLGLNVVVAAFVFGFIGRWIGSHIGARDVLTLVGGLVGAAAGFYSLYLHVTARTAPQRSEDGKQNR